jgi:hypothetical protein
LRRFELRCSDLQRGDLAAIVGDLVVENSLAGEQYMGIERENLDLAARCRRGGGIAGAGP